MSVVEPTLYELDPGGDTMLLVKAPSTMKQTKSDPDNRIVDELRIVTALATTASSIARENVDPVELAKKFRDVNLSDKAPIQQSSDSSIETTAECSSSTPDPKVEYVASFRVSSRHLILASPVFSEMFQSELTQNARSQSPKCMEVPLEGDDPDALLILMHLIHGRFKKVPRNVNLATLTQIAILVDKYELVETTELLIEGWISGVKKNIPSEFESDLLSYLLIGAVFQKHDMLDKASKVAILTSNAVVETGGLPIPGQVLDKINSQRETTLREIFAFLDETGEKLLNKQMCPSGRKCNALGLGYLMTGMKDFNLSPPPAYPYDGYSNQDVLWWLEEMEFPDRCGNATHSRESRSWVDAKCKGLRACINTKIRELGQQVGASLNC